MTDQFRRSAAASAEAPHDNARRLSILLSEMANDETRARISIGDLVDAFGDRAFGALIFIFAAPNAFPIMIPGISGVLGTPLLFLTWQLMVGRPTPWLPRIIRDRSFLRRDIAALVQRAAPWQKRIERLVRPRQLWLTDPVLERAIGAVALLLSVILFLPVPLGNVLPALAITLLALGILEKDGLMVVAGMAVAVGALAVVSGVVYGVVMAGFYIVRNIFHG